MQYRGFGGNRSGLYEIHSVPLAKQYTLVGTVVATPPRTSSPFFSVVWHFRVQISGAARCFSIIHILCNLLLYHFHFPSLVLFAFIQCSGIDTTDLVSDYRFKKILTGRSKPDLRINCFRNQRSLQPESRTWTCFRKQIKKHWSEPKNWRKRSKRTSALSVATIFKPHYFLATKTFPPLLCATESGTGLVQFWSTFRSISPLHWYLHLFRARR